MRSLRLRRQPLPPTGLPGAETAGIEKPSLPDEPQATWQERPWLVKGLGFGWLLLALSVFFILTVFITAGVGTYRLTYGQMAKLLLRYLAGEPFTPADATAFTVLFHVRLARILLAGVVGMGLGLAGAAFQGLLLNPLADPFTLGVSSGAAFGASLAIAVGLGGAGLGALGLLPLAALLGGLGSLFLVMFLGSVAGRMQAGTLILAGIIVSSFLSALISLIKSLFEDSLASIVFWIMGSFSVRGWQHLAFILPYVLPGSLILFLYARELNLLALGETVARQLGLEVGRTRLLLMVAASLVTAAAVSVSGIIGFVGLIVPHLMRMVVGPDHRRLLPTAALTGGCLLILADTLARSLLPQGQEVPVGVITALLGGPFFCYLLRATRGRTVL